MNSKQLHVDLAVFGGGSGGFGAALAAARNGLEVIVVEKSNRLGGNANRCGVNNWEPVVGATSLPFEIYRRLKALPRAVGVYGFGRHCLWDGYDVIPGGEHSIDPVLTYSDTLLRHGFVGLRGDEHFARTNLHGVAFEPEAYEQVLRSMLAETGRCTVRYETAFSEVDSADGQINAVTLTDGTVVVPRYVVDATGDGDLCESAGCEIMIGQESSKRFGEPSAPDEPNDKINGVTLMYRVARKTEGASEVDQAPDDIPRECWWRDHFPGAAIFEFPNGDWNINMLPTMEGREYLDMPYDEAYLECTRRARAHWRWVQEEYPEYRAYRLTYFADGIGVRESRRIVGEYVLTEGDVVAGFKAGYHEDTIAIADHALDRHGDKGGAKELNEPFTIPYRCLVAKGFTNLMVACRASSFSSIAASSCRLSRTMMLLGQAAGSAAAIAASTSSDLQSVPADQLRRSLEEQHVQLDYPMPDSIKRHLADDRPIEASIGS